MRVWNLGRKILFPLKIPLAFAVFHGGFGAFVIGAGAALGLARGGDFGDDLVEVRGGGVHGACAGDISNGAEAQMALK